MQVSHGSLKTHRVGNGRVSQCLCRYEEHCIKQVRIKLEHLGLFWLQFYVAVWWWTEETVSVWDTIWMSHLYYIVQETSANETEKPFLCGHLIHWAIHMHDHELIYVAFRHNNRGVTLLLWQGPVQMFSPVVMYILKSRVKLWRVCVGATLKRNGHKVCSC